MLLGSVIPYSANAEEFVMCNTDFTGCQAHVWITCAELQSGSTIGAVRKKAAEFCTGRGYRSSDVRQIGTSGSGGECGTYKYVVICQ